MLSILSLIIVFIENNLAVNGVILFISLPFITYNTRKEGSFICLFLTYIFISLQTDRYFYIFLILLIYIIISTIFLSHIEYNKKTIFYMLVLQILCYLVMTYKMFSVKYLVLNICGFIFWNYVYTKNIELKGNK